MNYRQLGATGLVVSEIGFGAWGIGGAGNGAVGYGPTDDRESETALRLAFEVGVTFYDTSDLYGYGHSESLIGNVFKDVRKEVVIATKVGFLRAYGPQDFSPKHIRKSIEGSLRRLRTDYVDLYQLHNPPMELLEEDEAITRTLDALVAEGKVRAVGISVRAPDDGLAAMKRFGFRCVQANFSMVDQRALNNGLLDLCRMENAGFICRTPLCFGFLTGKYSPQSRFDPGDHRSAWSSEQIELWANADRLFLSAASGCGPREETPAQTALRFCLSYPAVSTIIPGMLTSSQVEENTLASRLGPLSETAKRRIEAVYSENKFFVARNDA